MVLLVLQLSQSILLFLDFKFLKNFTICAVNGNALATDSPRVTAPIVPSIA